MAESTYALVSVAECREELRVVSDENDEDIGSIAKLVSEMIEEYIGRQVVSRSWAAVKTEKHYLEVPQSYLYLRNRPLKADPASIKVAGSAIDLTKLLFDWDAGRVVGIGGLRSHPLIPASALPDFPEDYGFRFGQAFGSVRGKIEVEYIAGYENTSKVSGSLKYAALQVVAALYRNRERKGQGMSSISSSVGTVSKFTLDAFSPEVEKMLKAERTYASTAITGLQ